MEQVVGRQARRHLSNCDSLRCDPIRSHCVPLVLRRDPTFRTLEPISRMLGAPGVSPVHTDASLVKGDELEDSTVIGSPVAGSVPLASEPEGQNSAPITFPALSSAKLGTPPPGSPSLPVKVIGNITGFPQPWKSDVGMNRRRPADEGFRLAGARRLSPLDVFQGYCLPS